MSRRRRTNLHKRTRTETSDSGTVRNSNRHNSAISDVTLNHFANSAVRTGSGGGSSVRMKKGSLTTAMKNLTVMNDNDERPWDERDDEDSDGTRCDGDGGGSEDVLRTTRDHKRRRRKVIGKPGGKEEVEGGADYPLDLWFLISEYIRPEDVGRFAGLCQATYYITTTTKFWLSMFRRHYHWSAELPDSFTYWNMDHRIKHVRVCVVRALFLMYAPFRARLSAEKPLSADPTQLLRAQCILQWHRKDGTQYKYFFKFAHAEHSGGRNGKLWKSANNASTYTNPHSGCWVLEATSIGVCAVPMVMGEYLYHAGVGVSANLCSHCLRLSLVPGLHLLPHSPNAPTRRHRVPATEITLDPVSNVRLYPWWHPQYWQVLEVECSDEEHW